MFILERSTTTAHVMAVLDVLRRHRHIWASMNVTKKITRTLFVAHQVYTARGLHCRPLTALLLDMDNDRNLEPKERNQLIEDITTFSHVCFPLKILVQA
jgi:mediator of RNA polymerase II transcription subunit 12